MSRGLRMSQEQLEALESGRRLAREGAIPERDEQKVCLWYARSHPKVAWCERMNTGATKFNDERFVKFGFAGCSDLIGQMKDGRFLAFEVKRKGNKPTDIQESFLGLVASNGGVSGWGQVEQLTELLENA